MELFLDFSSLSSFQLQKNIIIDKCYDSKLKNIIIVKCYDSKLKNIIIESGARASEEERRTNNKK